MKVLFIVPLPAIISPISSRRTRFPLNVGFLASVAEEAGHEVNIWDAISGDRGNRFDLLSYDFIGLSINSINYSPAIKIINRLEKARNKNKWNGRIAVGGPQVTVRPDTIPEFVDYKVVGEADEIITDMIDGNINKGILNPPLASDLDSLPFPAYHLYDWNLYDLTSLKEGIDISPVAIVCTSRGCPYSCNFCTAINLTGKTRRVMSPGRMIELIEYLQKDYKVKGIQFREDNFAVGRNRVEEFCELMLKKDIKLSWSIETRVDNVDKELLKLMKRAGLGYIYFGVESCSPRMLKLMDKGITLFQIRDALYWCKDLGINTYASLMVGLGETKKDMKITKDWMERLNPEFLCYNVYVGFPGSRAYDDLMKSGEFGRVEKSGLAWRKNHLKLVIKYYGFGFLIWNIIHTLNGLFPIFQKVVDLIKVRRDWLDKRKSNKIFKRNN